MFNGESMVECLGNLYLPGTSADGERNIELNEAVSSKTKRETPGVYGPSAFSPLVQITC